MAILSLPPDSPACGNLVFQQRLRLVVTSGRCATILRVRVRIGLPRSRNEWIVALIGAAVTVGCAIPLAHGVLSLSWPKVDGVITHSGNMPGRRAIGVDDRVSLRNRRSNLFRQRFQFQFALTSRRMRSRDVQSMLGRYRIGEPVKIAVNPVTLRIPSWSPAPISIALFRS